MLQGKMFLDLFKFITVKMDQFSALLTFTVEAGMSPLQMLSCVLKTGRRSRIDRILVDDSLIHQTFQLPVDSGLSDRRALFLKIFTHIARRDMPAGLILEV